MLKLLRRYLFSESILVTSVDQVGIDIQRGIVSVENRRLKIVRKDKDFYGPNVRRHGNLNEKREGLYDID